MFVGLSGQLPASVRNALGLRTLTSSRCVTWGAAHPCSDQGWREVLGLHLEFSGHRFDLVPESVRSPLALGALSARAVVSMAR